MVIREAGLLFRGFTLINGQYHKSGQTEIDKDLRAGLLTAMLNFAETAFKVDLIEYFEGSKYVVAFTGDEIMADDSIDPEPLIGYALLDKTKKIDKHIHKMVIPLLKEVIKQFCEKFTGKNLSEISQFRGFKNNLDEIFGSSTKKIDERLKSTIFFQKKE